MRSVKIVVEEHKDGFVAYPLGMNGVVVGQGDSVDEALSDVRSAIQFHIETFGDEAFADAAEVLSVKVTEAELAD